MIYTSYDMVRDCREGKPEGWSYFVANYVPVIRKLLAHYAGDPAPSVEILLAGLRNSPDSLFSSLDPAPERSVIAELRQAILASLPLPAVAIPLDLASVAELANPLTLLEKQAAWLETMRYNPADSGPLLRMAPATVSKIRERASELLRAGLSSWNRNLLLENGLSLGRDAAAAHTADCLPSKTFLDVLDGRSTWSDREEMERHVNSCWHCIDHFCRMAEVIGLLRNIQPLSPAESAPFLQSLGIEEPKPTGWKKWLAR